MVHKDPYEKLLKRRRDPARLEPGPEGGLTGECLVAGFATEPGRAQPETAMWHPHFHPLDPPTIGRSTGPGCAATWVWGKEPELVREMERSLIGDGPYSSLEFLRV